jgi:hypothetical protein
MSDLAAFLLARIEREEPGLPAGVAAMSPGDVLTGDVYGCICGLNANPRCPAWIGCNRGEVAREVARQAKRSEQRLADLVEEIAEAVPLKWRR